MGDGMSVYMHTYVRIWKNSAWLGTSIMTDRGAPLAEIVGQMSLLKYRCFDPGSSSV